jgi:hypothetical protein
VRDRADSPQPAAPLTYQSTHSVEYAPRFSTAGMVAFVMSSFALLTSAGALVLFGVLQFRVNPKLEEHGVSIICVTVVAWVIGLFWGLLACMERPRPRWPLPGLAVLMSGLTPLLWWLAAALN